jgi:hypothetical protein
MDHDCVLIPGLLVLIFLAGSDPLLPLVIGEDGAGDEDDYDDCDDELHG